MSSQNKLNKKDIEAILPNYNLSDDEYNDTLSILTEDDDKDYILGQIINYKNIFINNKEYTFKDYILAIRFVSYINSGFSNNDAFIKTFCFDKKIQELVIKNDRQSLGTRAGLYAKRPLVLAIIKETDYPLDLLYSGYKFQAIEVLRKEMLEAKISRDRIQAASSLLTNLTPKENKNFNITIHDNSKKTQIDIYREALEVLAEGQKQLIKNKENKPEEITDIINVDIIEK